MHVAFKRLNIIDPAEGFVSVCVGVRRCGGSRTLCLRKQDNRFWALLPSELRVGHVWQSWIPTKAELPRLSLPLSFVLWTRQLLPVGKLSLEPRGAVCQARLHRPLDQLGTRATIALTWTSSRSDLLLALEKRVLLTMSEKNVWWWQ